MTNIEYTEKIISSVDRILVDTSTLMSPSFQQFISTNKEHFIDKEIKIIIPKAVYTELARHMESVNTDKCTLALSAVELIDLNHDIFQVENSALTEEDIAHAFADAQLLSELTLHRTDYSQLLITNDRKLSCDAFRLNQQQSCKGHKVLVCYINWCGQLQCCECARPSKEEVNHTSTRPFVENSKPQSEDVSPTSSIEKHEESWKFDWLSGLLGVSSIGLLYGLYRGGKVVLQNTVKETNIWMR